MSDANDGGEGRKEDRVTSQSFETILYNLSISSHVSTST